MIISDRRTQCTTLRRLLTNSPGPYTRHDAAVPAPIIDSMVKSGYLIETGRKTGSGDLYYTVDPSNPYAAKLLRDIAADSDNSQTKITEVS